MCKSRLSNFTKCLRRGGLSNGGRYRTRTSDLVRVKQSRSRTAWTRAEFPNDYGLVGPGAYLQTLETATKPPPEPALCVESQRHAAWRRRYHVRRTILSTISRMCESWARRSRPTCP